MGGQLATFAGWDGCHLSLGSLAAETQEGLELLAELIAEASWPERELDRLKRLRFAELLAQRADPFSLADRAMLRALYGKQRYGTPAAGIRESVAAVERKRIAEDWSRHLRPIGSTLVAVGDLRPEALSGQIAELLGGWRGTRPFDPQPLPPPGPATGRVFIVNRADAAQSVLRIGWAGPPRDHSDFLATQVASSILGGKFTSRLNLRLRERDGATYGVHCQIAKRKGPGPFSVSSSLANEAVGGAVFAVREEVERLVDERVSASELDDACSYLEGLFAYSLQGIEGLASRLVETAVYGLPDDHFATFGRRLRSLDPETLRSVAARYLAPEAMVVAVAGPADALRPSLEPLGSAQVLNQDLEPA
jgi:zinc protease